MKRFAGTMEHFIERKPLISEECSANFRTPIIGRQGFFNEVIFLTLLCPIKKTAPKRLESSFVWFG